MVRNGQIISGVALFYNGAPAKGSLFCAIAAAGGTDAFGNVYGQGFNVGVWSAATGLQAQHFGIDLNGKVYVVNPAQKTVTFVDTDTGVILVYNSSGQSLGNLVVSIAPVAGTDSAGNAYPQGIQIGTGNTSIVLTVGASFSVARLKSGDATDLAPGAIYATETGFASQQRFTNVVAPLPAAHAATAFVAPLSSSDDGAIQSGVLMGVGTDPKSSGGTTTGAGQLYAGSVKVGAGFSNGVTSAPIYAQKTNYFQGDGWNPMTGSYLNSFSDFGGGNVTGKYRLVASPPNSVEIIGTVTHAAFAGALAFFTLPLGYRPATNQNVTGGWNSGPTNTMQAMACTTAGVLTFQNAPASTTTCEFHGFIALDA